MYVVYLFTQLSGGRVNLSEWSGDLLWGTLATFVVWSAVGFVLVPMWRWRKWAPIALVLLVIFGIVAYAAWSAGDISFEIPTSLASTVPELRLFEATGTPTIPGRLLADTAEANLMGTRSAIRKSPPCKTLAAPWLTPPPGMPRISLILLGTAVPTPNATIIAHRTAVSADGLVRGTARAQLEGLIGCPYN